ncbi:unnamed protein product, partial [Prorocentrum cordatum]
GVGMTADVVALFADRYRVALVFGGADDRTATGLAQRAIQTVKLTALEAKRDVQRQGMTYVSDAEAVEDFPMVASPSMNYGGAVPAQGVFGCMPNDACYPEAGGLTACSSALDQTQQKQDPGWMGTMKGTPSDLFENAPMIWKLATELGTAIFEMTSVQGIVYGSGVRMVNKLSGVAHSIVIACLDNHPCEYYSTEIETSQTIGVQQ